jgi:dihydroxyacetone kinase phosphoprotein-dependent L subunit
VSTLRICILVALDAIEAACAELGNLDRAIGDGDHGITMTIGARAVRQRLESAPEAVGTDLLKQVALGMGSVGGAIGPIYATGLARVAGGTFGTPVTVADLRLASETAEAAIMTLGKANPGDKTIVDALHALVESLRESEAHGADLRIAVRAAADAAREGAASTAGMVAKMGRASRLGERSLGTADPGAMSFALAIDVLADAYLSL